MHFLVWLISGILAGWLTGLVIKGQGFGLLGDLVVGLLGGLVGGWLFSLMGLTAYNWLGEIVGAVMGGISLVVVIRFLRQVCQKAVTRRQKAASSRQNRHHCFLPTAFCLLPYYFCPGSIHQILDPTGSLVIQ